MACDLGRFRIYLPNLHVNKEVHGQGSERGQPRSPSHRGGGWGVRPHPWAPPAPCCGAQAFAARSGRPRAPSPARPSAGRPTRPFCPLRPGAVSRESAAQGARRRPGSGDRSSPGSRLGGKESAAVSLGGLGGTEHSSAPAELHRRTSRGRPPGAPGSCRPTSALTAGLC